MAEYIKREKVGEDLNGLLNDLMDDTEHTEEFVRGFEQALRCVWNKVADIPSADIRPERHGVWVRVSDDDQDEGRFICSECKEEYFNPAGDEEEMLPKFCPCCGAKMDGKDRTANENSSDNI